MPIFQSFYELKLKTSKLKSWHFEASEDIMTKFKTQALHIIRIKYQMLVAVATLLPHSQPLEHSHFTS